MTKGKADSFLEDGLRPWLLVDACKDAGIKIKLRMHENYDHSYFFISTFMKDHLHWHHFRAFKKPKIKLSFSVAMMGRLVVIKNRVARNGTILRLNASKSVQAENLALIVAIFLAGECYCNIFLESGSQILLTDRANKQMQMVRRTGSHLQTMRLFGRSSSNSLF